MPPLFRMTTARGLGHFGCQVEIYW